ncbi:immunoglobulin superfamily member 23 isoform X3 [Macaca mulatta]
MRLEVTSEPTCPWTEYKMRSPLDISSSHTPAWRKLLLTGTLLTSCTCSVFSELPFSAQLNTLTEGASVHLPVPRSLEDSLQLMPLKTFPAAIRGVIQSELNYSVILQWVVTMDPEPVLSWTFNGVPCGMGEKLFIRRLSWEQLGTYMCIATNSKKQLVSEPVTISLPEPIAQPTEAEPMEPDPTLSLSGGSAIGLLVAGILGAGTLIAGVCFTIIQSLRTDRQRIGICS